MARIRCWCLDDADVEVASSGAVWGAFVNAGQACLSVERCFVHRSLYQTFLDACVRKTRELRVGNGTDPDTDVGPMIHERQLRNVESQGGGRPFSGRACAGGWRAHAGIWGEIFMRQPCSLTLRQRCALYGRMKLLVRFYR